MMFNTNTGADPVTYTLPSSSMWVTSPTWPMYQHPGKCPNCGYCPCCGRADKEKV